MVHDGASKRGGDFVTSVARLARGDVAGGLSRGGFAVAGGAGAGLNRGVDESRAEERGGAFMTGLAGCAGGDVGCRLLLDVGEVGVVASGAG